MGLSSWLRMWKRSDLSARRGQRASFRPRLEGLEDRALPSAGALDPTFGIGGKVTTDFLGPTVDIADAVTVIQADGKIVAVGAAAPIAGAFDFAVARYNSDGTLDTTFGTGGKVTTGFPGGVANGVAIQTDGKIVVAGSCYLTGTGGDFALVRYNSDGSLDTSFGSGGKVTTDFAGAADQANGVAIQAGGKIVLAGFTVQPLSGAPDFALARYNSNGSLDSTFGSGGKVITDFAGAADQANGVAIQTDGKIVAAGISIQSVTLQDFALARYNSDGSLDTSFGSGGKVTTDFAGANDAAFGVAIQASDGRIVAAGGSQSGTGAGFALARYKTNGSLDTTFGSGGKVITDIGSIFDVARAVAIQADSKIVAAGFSGQSDTGADFALARYNTNGSLDTTFDGDGKVTTDFGSPSDLAYGVALQADGKIVAAGTSYQLGTGNDFALARYNGNGSLDTSFGSGGEVTTNITVGRSFDFGRGGVALQADGKLVVAGGTENVAGQDFALARYNSDGSLDTSFGAGGQVTTDFGGYDLATGVAIQDNGKIVVVGETYSPGSTTYTDFALARYNSDGSLDTNFGSGGKVITDFGSSEDQAFAVALQGGKIVVAGQSNGNFALARYNSNGGLDTTFNSSGEATTTFAGFGDYAYSVAIQADGQVCAAGLSNQSSTGSDFALARYNSDGSLDTSFGSGGKVITDFAGNFDVVSGVAIQADGKIVGGGVSYQTTTGFDFALARYNSDGSLDKKFGKKGKVTTDFGSPDDEAFGLALQGDGKIVVVGETLQPATGYDFALARYNSDGNLDTSFGSGGKVTTDFAGFDEQAIGVVIQADGKIVAAGTSYQLGTAYDFAVARYIGASPSQPIQAIISNVQALVTSGVLNNGQGNSLLVKLEHSAQHLDSGQTTTAVNDLQAFVNEVNDFLSENILTSTEGKLLIDEANAVIALLTQKK